MCFLWPYTLCGDHPHLIYVYCIYVYVYVYNITAVRICSLQPLKRPRSLAWCFTSLFDSSGQAGVDVLSVDVKPSVEFMTRLVPLPVQVLQQLS